MSKAFRVVYVLWAGSLWSLAAWVATTVFALEPDRQLAGRIAARLFGIETYLGAALALVALLLPSRARFFWTYPAAALLLFNEWVLKPIMSGARVHGPVFGLSFGAWHGVSALLYVGACVAVVLVVWKDERGPQPTAGVQPGGAQPGGAQPGNGRAGSPQPPSARAGSAPS